MKENTLVFFWKCVTLSIIAIQDQQSCWMQLMKWIYSFNGIYSSVHAWINAVIHSIIAEPSHTPSEYKHILLIVA